MRNIKWLDYWTYIWCSERIYAYCIERSKFCERKAADLIVRDGNTFDLGLPRWISLKRSNLRKDWTHSYVFDIQKTHSALCWSKKPFLEVGMQTRSKTDGMRRREAMRSSHNIPLGVIRTEQFENGVNSLREGVDIAAKLQMQKWWGSQHPVNLQGTPTSRWKSMIYFVGPAFASSPSSVFHIDGQEFFPYKRV